MRGTLADPVFLTLALAGFGLVLIFSARRRRLGQALILAALAILYALATQAVSARLLALAEPPPVAWSTVLDGMRDSPEVQRPQAIVVLSGGLQRQPSWLGGDTVAQDTLERLVHAARLWRQTGLPVLVSGGPVHGATRTLAATMAVSLTHDFAVPVAWQEARSTTTEENARFSRDILAPVGIDRIYLVSDAAHLPRAAAIFQTTGFVVTPMPTVYSYPAARLALRDLLPRAFNLEVSARALHELVGSLAYRLLYHR